MSTVTVAPVVEAGSYPPRVRLNVTDSGTPAVFSTTVMRTGADGRAVPVRTYDGGPLPLSTSGSNRVGLLYDYEAPFGESVTYSTVQSPTAVSSPVTLDVGQVWLIHPGVPGLSVPVTVGSFGERQRSLTRGVFRPMGTAAPVVHTDGARHSAEYDLSVVTFSNDQADALWVLLEDAAPLLLNIPAGKGWGVTHEYVAVGEVTEARVARVAAEPTRRWTLPLTVIDRPAGGTQAGRTYADLPSEGATYSALAAARPTYYDVLTG